MSGEFVRGWSLSLYESAAEAGGAWSSGNAPIPRPRARSEPDAERAAAEANRRARAKLRRYAAANGLNRLGTLTYAGPGCHDQVVFRGHMAEFFRSLRALLGGQRFPYAWVAEWHKSGHGLHAHFAVGRYIKRSKIESAWGRGFVHITLLGDLPVGSGTRAEARLAARYLSKYIGKDLGETRLQGLHRYEVAQGFQPSSTRLRARTLGKVVDLAVGVMGAPPSYLWQSQASEGWQGPPAVWMSWD